MSDRGCAAMSAPVPGAVFAERYELVRPMGAGARGPLWLARDRVLPGTEVALELASAEAWERAVRDATLARGLDHPRVVRLIHVEPGAAPFLVWEYVPGLTLARDLAARGQSLSPIDALRIVEELAPALDAIHARGAVVRDLDATRVTVGNGARLAYAGLDPVGEVGRPDVRALGALVHEMLTLEPAGGEGTPALDVVPAAVAQVVRRALAPWPQDRPPSAGAFADELAEAVYGRRARARRTRHAAAGLVITVLLALAHSAQRGPPRGAAPARPSGAATVAASPPRPAPSATPSPSAAADVPTRGGQGTASREARTDSPAPDATAPVEPPRRASPARPAPLTAPLPSARALAEFAHTAPQSGTFVTGSFALRPAKLKLTYRFTAGEPLEYRSTTRMRSELKAPDGTERKSATTLEIHSEQMLAEALADGVNRITARVLRAELFVDNEARPGPFPANVTYAGTLKPSGEVVAGDLPAGTRPELVLPDQPVGKGDSWEHTTRLTEPVAATSTMRYTVRDVSFQLNGYEGLLVSIDVTATIDSPDVIEQRVTGRILFDADRGRIVELWMRSTLGVKVGKDKLDRVRIFADTLLERVRR